ncbi:ATP-binding protein [Aspergillus melleus]|uniref:ATP-binding protein n=1 Tax=Aspergillus melleus TaxID=138277 RepID=UPI001E8EA851|nr:uncharacterized protein LDX57_002728 [Aspergillus melleus]KAH8424982.1 hypothetical protein LDX57_002728 [Aspergillus melleus]
MSPFIEEPQFQADAPPYHLQSKMVEHAVVDVGGSEISPGLSCLPNGDSENPVLSVDPNEGPHQDQEIRSAGSAETSGRSESEPGENEQTDAAEELRRLDRLSRRLARRERSPDEDRIKDLRTYQEFSKQCSRADGIVYVPSNVWERFYPYSHDCHCYVGTSTPLTPPLHGDGQADEAIHVGPELKAPTTSIEKPLPDRVGIVNELLMSAMRSVLGTTYTQHDHVPPFRALVPYEQQFRAMLQEKEAQLAEQAAQNPQHPAVTRTRPWLPKQYSYLKSIGTNRDGAILWDEEAEDLTIDLLDETRILVDGLRTLVHFLDHDLSSLVQTYRQAQAGSLDRISFSHLFYLFWPGQEIVTKQPNYQIYRVVQVSRGRKSLAPRKDKYSFRNTVSPLAIDCFSLDYDGHHVRPVATTLFIRPYDGIVAITSLKAYPLQYDDAHQRDAIITRGRKFVELVQVTHRRYHGLNLTEGTFDSNVEIDSDVIIDFELAIRNREVTPPQYNGGVIVSPTEEDEEETHSSNWNFDYPELQTRRWSQFVKTTPLLEDRSLDQLGPDHLVLLPYRVYGYVLLSRKWYPLDIDKITELRRPNSGERDAFDDLVLPLRHRKIVRALVKTHAWKTPETNSSSSSSSSRLPEMPVQREFDVVKGKGKGLVILLHGAPGVGKTSTAECVAAHTGRPLFPITCGDLGGNNAQEVETNLERFFDLARKWGCVLLLDEADVFLGERVAGNLQQNSLVSVFLRVLEYYSGILILTTNRVGQFDEAAISRIDCALYYENFDKKRTLEVWKKNIDRLERQNNNNNLNSPLLQDGTSQKAPGVSVDFNRDKILRFAKRQWNQGIRWNGRQIKNAFKTAHFEEVTKASVHFESYLTATRESDGERAKAQQLRQDDWTQKIPREYRPGWQGSSVGAGARDNNGEELWSSSEESEWDSEDDDEEEERSNESASESQTDESESEVETTKKRGNKQKKSSKSSQGKEKEKEKDKRKVKAKKKAKGKRGSSTKKSKKHLVDTESAESESEE